jgi:hypothetical protein
MTFFLVSCQGLACQGDGQVDVTGADENRVFSFFSYSARIGMVGKKPHHGE